MKPAAPRRAFACTWLTGLALGITACADASATSGSATSGSATSGSATSGSGTTMTEATPGPATTNGADSAATVKPTADLLGAMATLMGSPAESKYVGEWARKIDSGEAQLGNYIDELLASDRFAAEVMPALLFGAFVNVRNYYALPSAFVLKTGAEGPLYLREPCPASEAVTVRPWWDLSSEVKVCLDAYRPKKWTMSPDEHSYRTRMVLTCDSQVGSPELETKSLCGCGPNLIRCLRDEDQYNELNRSLMAEVKRTTAYVIQNDMPMATLFTGNSTFRDRNAELYYRRQKIGALEIKRVEPVLAGLGKWLPPGTNFKEPTADELGTWPVGGKWAPREELKAGQHAGVLTAPQILHWLPDRRQRQRGYYEMMWCNLRNSFGATTQKVLELNATGNIAFVHDSWERLAHTELCTNCHARLDYGFQFFMGYPDSRASTHFTPALQSKRSGPLYGQDIRDLRGNAELTPQGFAKLATEQPDFQSCMTSHFVSYVLGDRATGDDVRAIETAVTQTAQFKPPMKVALERYAAKWREDTTASPRAPAPVSAPQPAAPGKMPVSAELRAKLDTHCVDCHDGAPYTDKSEGDDLPFEFTSSELPRPLMISMAEQVAFGMMPKHQFLDAKAREELVGLLINTLWTDPAARVEAEHYYLGRSHGLPAHQIDNAIFSIDQIAGAQPSIAWGALERGIWSDQSTITPGFLAITALEALRACAQGGELRGVKLEDCLLRATSLTALSRSPSP